MSSSDDDQDRPSDPKQPRIDGAGKGKGKKGGDGSLDAGDLRSVIRDAVREILREQREDASTSVQGSSGKGG